MLSPCQDGFQADKTEVAHPKILVMLANVGEHATEPENWMTLLVPVDDVKHFSVWHPSIIMATSQRYWWTTDSTPPFKTAILRAFIMSCLSRLVLGGWTEIHISGIPGCSSKCGQAVLLVLGQTVRSSIVMTLSWEYMIT